MKHKWEDRTSRLVDIYSLSPRITRVPIQDDYWQQRVFKAPLEHIACVPYRYMPNYPEDILYYVRKTPKGWKLS